MSNSAAAQEPSMEEILASIRRIITDEEGNPTSEQKSQEDSESAREMLGNGAAETEDGLLSSSQPMSPDDLDALFASDEDDDAVSAPTEAAEVDSDGSKLEEALSEDDEVMELTAAEIEDDESNIDDNQDEMELIEGMDIVFDEIDDELAGPEPVVQAALSPEPMPEAASVVEPASAPAEHASNLESLISQQAATSVSESFSSLSGLLVSSQARTMEDLLKEMLRPMLQSWLDENLPSLVEKMVAAEIRRLSGKG